MILGKFIEELKTAPVDEVDFVGAFFEVKFGCSYSTPPNVNILRCSKTDDIPLWGADRPYIQGLPNSNSTSILVICQLDLWVGFDVNKFCSIQEKL